MRNTLITSATTCCALAVVLGGIGAVHAQDGGETRVLEEVVVVAPRLVRHEERTPTGSRVERVSLTRHVSVGDLDLTRHRDVMRLEQRVRETAEEACAYLAEMFPLATSESPDCVRRAVDGAMAQAEEAIAAANE